MTRTAIRHCLPVTLALLLSALVVPAQAQTGTVTGRVASPADQALVGAQVSLVGIGLGTRTGEGGR
ncbi:MAG TPA: hypothetical protein VFT29_08800 [Gemmatimonadaceae bacterium]|nr:hypothetical protein [Gemmatimonadaceae bacterium]